MSEPTERVVEFARTTTPPHDALVAAAGQLDRFRSASKRGAGSLTATALATVGTQDDPLWTAWITGAAAAAADDPPDLSKFQKVVLGQGTGLGEVMELTVAPDGRVFFITRAGDISMYDPTDGSIEIVMNNPSLGVWSGLEDGGLGITVDPDFADNGWTVREVQAVADAVTGTVDDDGLAQVLEELSAAGLPAAS